LGLEDLGIKIQNWDKFGDIYLPPLQIKRYHIHMPEYGSCSELKQLQTCCEGIYHELMQGFTCFQQCCSLMIHKKKKKKKKKKKMKMKIMKME